MRVSAGVVTISGLVTHQRFIKKLHLHAAFFSNAALHRARISSVIKVLAPTQP